MTENSATWMAGFHAGMQQAAYDSYRVNLAASMSADARRYITEAEQTDLMCGTVEDWHDSAHDVMHRWGNAR